MRVLEIFTSTVRSGAEEVAFTLAQAMVKSGWVVHAAFPHTSHNAHLVKDFRTIGTMTHALAIDEIPQGKYGSLKLFQRSLHVALLLLRIKPAIVVIHLPWQNHAMPAIFACALLNRPTVMIFHLAPAPINISKKRLELINWAHKRNQTWVVVSDHNKRQVASTFGISDNGILRIYNGANIDARPVRAPVATSNLRHELGLGTNVKLILTVGRLDMSKGLGDIVPAIPRLKQLYPNIKFVWTGEGPARRELEELLLRHQVREDVVFLGRRDDVPALLAECDIFLFPTHMEGLSLALLEAASTGIPIIAADSTSNPEVIQHLHNGLLFETGNTEGLFTQVQFALENMNVMLALADQAKSDMRNFSLDLMLQQHLELYTKLVNGV